MTNRERKGGSSVLEPKPREKGVPFAGGSLLQKEKKKWARDPPERGRKERRSGAE